MNPRARAQAELAAVPGWTAGDAGIVRALRHGHASDTWLVRRAGEYFVLRIDHEGAARFAHDRSAELAIVTAAAQAGLTPAPLHAVPERGVFLRRHIAGRAWGIGHLGDPARLQQLAALLRQLHALAPPVRRFDLAGAVAGYAQQLGDSAATTLARQVGDLVAAASPAPLVLCHNDLVHDNIIETDRLWLIDWEFSGLGNACFDLAVLSQHHAFNTEQRAILLDAYGGDVNGEEFDRWRRIYDGVVELWRRVISAPG